LTPCSSLPSHLVRAVWSILRLELSPPLLSRMKSQCSNDISTTVVRNWHSTVHLSPFTLVPFAFFFGYLSHRGGWLFENPKSPLVHFLIFTWSLCCMHFLPLLRPDTSLWLSLLPFHLGSSTNLQLYLFTDVPFPIFPFLPLLFFSLCLSYLF